MNKNSSLLFLGIVSISLLIIFSAIQSSNAQRYDDDHDNDTTMTMMMISN